jgi:hypothetical protein
MKRMASSEALWTGGCTEQEQDVMNVTLVSGLRQIRTESVVMFFHWRCVSGLSPGQAPETQGRGVHNVQHSLPP